MVKNFGFFSKNGCSKRSSEHVDSIWTSVLKLFLAKVRYVFAQTPKMIGKSS